MVFLRLAKRRLSILLYSKLGEARLDTYCLIGVGGRFSQPMDFDEKGGMVGFALSFCCFRPDRSSRQSPKRETPVDSIKEVGHLSFVVVAASEAN
jgi:hypothetical protein